jgi:hypothetical protein
MFKMSQGMADQVANDIADMFQYAVIGIYSDTQPADGNAAENGTLLCWITLDGETMTDPMTVANGLELDVSTIAYDSTTLILQISKPTAAIWKGDPIANGNIGYGRVYDLDVDTGLSATAIRFDGSAGISSGQFQLSSSKCEVGVPLVVNSFTIKIPLTRR